MVNSIRKAVYDACVMTGLNVFDYWVVDAVYPYIIIANVAADNTYYKLDEMEDTLIDIHIFVKVVGKTSVINHLDTIKNLLKEMDGVDIRISIRTLSEKELGVVHGVLSFQVKKYTQR